MHWLEDWMRRECCLDRKPDCRACRDMCIPKIVLAKETGVPMRLIDRIIYDGWITHPNFADAIADFTGALPWQRDSMVNEIHRGKWKPGRRRKRKTAKAEYTGDSHYKWKERPVVLIDRKGNERKRFAGAQAAADYAGKGRNYIYSRCERRISQQTDEFARTEESFRWADEWDRMSPEERAEDVRNKYRESGKCTCSAMPRVFEFQGERHTIAEWARICMLPESTLRERIKAGWDIEKAIKTPLRSYGEYKREEK